MPAPQPPRPPRPPQPPQPSRDRLLTRRVALIAEILLMAIAAGNLIFRFAPLLWSLACIFLSILIALYIRRPEIEDIQGRLLSGEPEDRPPMHRCPRCGYELRGLETAIMCPECGLPVKGWAQEVRGDPPT